MNPNEPTQSELNTVEEKNDQDQRLGQVKEFPARTMSASAVDFKHSKNMSEAGTLLSTPPNNLYQFSFSASDEQPPSTDRHSMGVKRKLSSYDYSSTNNPIKLPSFTSTFLQGFPNSQVYKPKPTNAERCALPNTTEFITPTQPKKQQSRPNSPSNFVSRVILPRSRVASIRRESDCNSEKKFGETEAAHEKMVKSAQQVAMGFEDFCLDDKSFEERKRAKSLTEPISIFTNAFLPQSSSPSPSRGCMEGQKQCYSPSAQQVVRSNLAYSPSPSPTPASSPSVHRMRSMSPIAVRQIAKRRYTGSSNGNGNASGLESDGEGSTSSFSNSMPAIKRQCTTPKSNSNSSPLVRDATAILIAQQSPLLSTSSSSMVDFLSASTVSFSAVPGLSARFGSSNSERFLVDPNLAHFPSSSTFQEENIEEEDDESRSNQLVPPFCSHSIFNDANSSTTFSSRANTPENSQFALDIEHSAASLFHPPPSHSTCSSDGTSSSCSANQLLADTPGHSSCTVKPVGPGFLPLSDAPSAVRLSSSTNYDVGEDERGKAKVDQMSGKIA